MKKHCDFEVSPIKVPSSYQSEAAHSSTKVIPVHGAKLAKIADLNKLNRLRLYSHGHNLHLEMTNTVLQIAQPKQ